MFTSSMYDRLSEWMANLSLLLLGTIVIPVFYEVDKVTPINLLLGAGLSILSLWSSLRLARLAERIK